MSGQQWEYLHMSLTTGQVEKMAQRERETLDAELNAAGAAGFELVGWATSDNFVAGLWVAVLKRPGKRRTSPDGEKGENEGWYRDPYASHEQRYWSGYYWTQHVSDAGTQSEDVPG
jgi:hypothetical protein